MILTSQVTCPRCGYVSIESMPTDACIYFYDCAGCGAVLRPQAGDCCVSVPMGLFHVPRSRPTQRAAAHGAAIPNKSGRPRAFKPQPARVVQARVRKLMKAYRKLDRYSKGSQAIGVRILLVCGRN